MLTVDIRLGSFVSYTQESLTKGRRARSPVTPINYPGYYCSRAVPVSALQRKEQRHETYSGYYSFIIAGCFFNFPNYLYSLIPSKVNSQRRWLVRAEQQFKHQYLVG